MTQKLVSIWMCDVNSTAGEQKEHLKEYLDAGWRIMQITPLDGSGGGDATASGGWVFVLMER